MVEVALSVVNAPVLGVLLPIGGGDDKLIKLVI